MTMYKCLACICSSLAPEVSAFGCLNEFVSRSSGGQEAGDGDGVGVARRVYPVAVSLGDGDLQRLVTESSDWIVRRGARGEVWCARSSEA